MGNSSSYLAYPDVKDAFDRALLGKGIKIAFKERGAAIRFAARCNAFRLLDRKENARLYEATHSLHGRSPYDGLKIARVENAVEITPLSLDIESVTDL